MGPSRCCDAARGRRRRVEHGAPARDRPRQASPDAPRDARARRGVERDGAIPPDELAETARHRAELRRGSLPRRAPTDVEVLVTSPGRQAANGDELRDAIAAATARVPVRLLSAAGGGPARVHRRAGQRARRGLARRRGRGRRRRRRVGADRRRVGTRPAVALDALDRHRLAAAREPLLHGDPPAARGSPRRARRSSARSPGSSPEFAAALAVGGSARALSGLVGGRIGRRELEEALEILGATSAEKLARQYDVEPASGAETLAAGAMILAALQDRLDVPLRVVPAGASARARSASSRPGARPPSGRPRAPRRSCGDRRRAACAGRAPRRARSSPTMRPAATAALPRRGRTRTRSSATTAS